MSDTPEPAYVELVGEPAGLDLLRVEALRAATLTFGDRMINDVDAQHTLIHRAEHYERYLSGHYAPYGAFSPSGKQLCRCGELWPCPHDPLAMAMETQ